MIIGQTLLNDATKASDRTLAQAIAESHMLAQMVTNQYDYCQFFWTKENSIICDGQEYSLSELLEENIIAWFMQFIPMKVAQVVLAIAKYSDVSCGIEPEEFNKMLVISLHELLKDEYKDTINCFCENPCCL